MVLLGSLEVTRRFAPADRSGEYAAGHGLPALYGANWLNPPAAECDVSRAWSVGQ